MYFSIRQASNDGKWYLIQDAKRPFRYLKSRFVYKKLVKKKFTFIFDLVPSTTENCKFYNDLRLFLQFLQIPFTI